MKWLTGMVFIILAMYSMSAAATEPLIIDGFDDGNNVSEEGGWWYVYNDARTGGNTQVTPLGTLTPTQTNGSQGYAAHVEGTAGNQLGWDYFGFGVTLTATSGCPNQVKVDIRQYTTLEFKMKGDASGGRLTVSLPYTGGSCEGDIPETLTGWADYEASVTADLTGEWQTVRLNLRNDFTQPFWAKPEDKVSIEDVLQNASQLQWHFSSADGDTLSVWIDDIKLY